MKTYIIEKDGNAWCAHDSDFINLQESEAAFGDTPVESLRNFLGETKAESGELESLRKVFAHNHVNNGIDDGCKRCGLDLRNEIHIRVAA